MNFSPRPVTAFCSACLMLLLASVSSAQQKDALRLGKAPTFASTSKESVLLRYKLKKDQVEKLAMNIDMVMRVRQGGKELKMKMAMQIEAKVRVTAVDDKGNITALVKITRMYTKFTGAKEVEFDSDKPNDDPNFKGVAAMINVGIPCKMSPVGKMLETDLEPLRLAARRANAAALAKTFEDSTKQMFEGTYVQLSERAVKAGDSYKAGTIVSDKVKIHNSYRIRSVSGDRNRAVLEPVAVLEMAKGAFPRGVDARIKSQRLTGWILFDVEKGYASKAEVRLNMVLEISADGQAATMETTTKTTLTSSLK